MNMTFDQAVTSLKIREEWDIITEYLDAQREAAIADFQTPDHVDNACKLARLAGEVAAYDSIIRIFRDAPGSSTTVSG